MKRKTKLILKLLASKLIVVQLPYHILANEPLDINLFGIISALLGHFLLANSPGLTSHFLTFASGGILYLLIQDIIPTSKLAKNYLTSLGATLGFLVRGHRRKNNLKLLTTKPIDLYKYRIVFKS